jgi:NTE family protein
VDRTTYFEKLVGSVTRIARHSYYPGKEEAVEICLSEIEDLADAGRISIVQLAALRDLLLGEEGFCLPEGVFRERECCEREFGDDRIAIICQGAGSQAAFSAGVLQGLFHPRVAGRPIVGLGGTGFGSVCATLAWDGLLRGDSNRAVDRIESFWRDYEADSTIDALANYSSQMLLHLRAIVPLGEPGLGGYSALGLEQLRRVLNRHVEFDTDRCMASREKAPALAISSIDAAGEIREVQGPEITAEAVAASADGLFFNQPSAGPRTTADAPSRPCSTIQAMAAAKPSEIWLIQITKTGRGRSRGPCGDLPSFVEQIESQLLEREIAYVQSVNRMLKRGMLTEGRGYRHIEVHRIIMEHDLDDASKLDRSPGFIGGLMTYGRDRAAQFLEKRACSLTTRRATARLR